MDKKTIKKIFIILAILVCIFILETSRKSFLRYEKNIITEQQEQLLTISKLVGKSFLDFTSEQVNKVEYLSENIKFDINQNKKGDFLEKRLEAFDKSNKKKILRLRYLDIKNKKTYAYPNIEEEFPFNNQEEFDKFMRNKKVEKDSFIGEAYEFKNQNYGFDIFKAVYTNGDIVGVIIVTIDMNNMYDLVARPIKIGREGYVVLKDSDGIIIMHPLKEQIGYDVLADRKEKHPELDYKELEGLVKQQLSGKEGTYIYHSYWWAKEKLQKVKKFQSFTSIDLTEKFWVVAVTTDYDEVGGAIKTYLRNITIVAITLISIIAIAIVIIIRMIGIEESHRMEINYLRDINDSLEDLRKKEIELHEKKKIETIGTLTGGIAHEFNNILTPIMGYSEMILMGLDPDDEIYNKMKIINDSSKRARDVIGEVLKFSGNKDIKTQYEVLEISEVVEKSLKLFETATPSNINIIKKIPKDMGSIYANESQIYQVLLELCVNAYNLMEIEGGDLQLTLTEVNLDEDKNIRNIKMYNKEYIKLSIKNERILKKTLCEKENKIEEKLLLEKLSSVSEVIVKHGGKLFVEGNEKINFEVYLPKINSKPEKELEGSFKGSERLLIVDDEKFIVEMLKKTLEDLGYKTITYTNSTDVIKDFNILKDRVDVIISDIRMPEVTGLQIARKFKRDKPNIKVILITANTEEPLEEYLQSNIIDDYILKPISVKKISGRIRTVLRKKGNL